MVCVADDHNLGVEAKFRNHLAEWRCSRQIGPNNKKFMGNALGFLERRECVDESRQITSFGRLSDVDHIGNILAKDSPPPIGECRTILQRAKPARVHAVRDHLYLFCRQMVKAHYVLLAVLANRRHAGRASRAPCVSYPGFVQRPPTERLRITFVGTMVNQECWASGQDWNDITRTEQKVLASMRPRQSVLLP